LLHIFVELFQLKEMGFTEVDALDPADEMLNIAKAEGTYNKYITCFLSEEQTDIPNGKFYQLLTHQL
jgi:hypothetical protein